MKILISAYACEPGKGSEPEVGLRIAEIAASQHEVWVITRENNLDSLKEYFSDHPNGGRVHLTGLDLVGLPRRVKKLGGLLSLHWYYDAWQRELAKVAVAMDREIDFDVVHHATFATYWSRTGLSAVDKPMVWGPVGGAVTPPMRIMPIMGWKGVLSDVARTIGRPVIARITGVSLTSRKASVVLIQNPETGRRLKQAKHQVLVPNALSAFDRNVAQTHKRDDHRLVAAGRLIGLKGFALPILAMRHLPEPFHLQIFGEGSQRKRLDRLIRKYGLGNRVKLCGAVPREQFLSSLRSCSVFVHGALHDESPLTVAEALGSGTPLVALQRGGPAVIASMFPDVPSRLVRPSTIKGTAQQIAEGILEVADQDVSREITPRVDFGQAILDAYLTAVRPEPTV